jgi:hypothetical protein
MAVKMAKGFGEEKEEEEGGEEWVDEEVLSRCFLEACMAVEKEKEEEGEEEVDEDVFLCMGVMAKGLGEEKEGEEKGEEEDEERGVNRPPTNCNASNNPTSDWRLFALREIVGAVCASQCV